MTKITSSLILTAMSGAVAYSTKYVDIGLFEIWLGIISLALLVGAIAELSD
ncbi:MAG: hypothetical protein KAT71_08220 [Gammaproteobacteria bacterium]|nr:hypothetical protein [Gammaproteobacteria bacterium]